MAMETDETRRMSCPRKIWWDCVNEDTQLLGLPQDVQFLNIRSSADAEKPARCNIIRREEKYRLAAVPPYHIQREY